MLTLILGFFSLACLVTPINASAVLRLLCYNVASYCSSAVVVVIVVYVVLLLKDQLVLLQPPFF